MGIELVPDSTLDVIARSLDQDPEPIRRKCAERQQQRQSRVHVVYLVSFPCAKVLKLGMTRLLPGRMEHYRDGYVHPAAGIEVGDYPELLGSIECPNWDSARRLEQEMLKHPAFRTYLLCGAEWFVDNETSRLHFQRASRVEGDRR